LKTSENDEAIILDGLKSWWIKTADKKGSLSKNAVKTV